MEDYPDSPTADTLYLLSLQMAADAAGEYFTLRSSFYKSFYLEPISATWSFFLFNAFLSGSLGKR